MREELDAALSAGAKRRLLLLLRAPYDATVVGYDPVSYARERAKCVHRLSTITMLCFLRLYLRSAALIAIFAVSCAGCDALAESRGAAPAQVRNQRYRLSLVA